MELAERLASELTRMPNGCLVWTGCTIRGYGQFTLHRKTYKTHRLAWSLANAQPVPEGMCILHSCDNPPCCEPSHLRPGTNAQNSADMVAKGRQGNQNALKAECIHGHEFTESNTYMNPPGRRNCRKCGSLRMAQWYRRKTLKQREQS